MGNWYECCVEEPVRDLVKVLRNHGFNTECSCGHEMYVQCGYHPEGEIRRLHDLLYCYMSENKKKINYEILVRVSVIDGHVTASLDVRFPKNITDYSFYGHKKAASRKTRPKTGQ